MILRLDAKREHQSFVRKTICRIKSVNAFIHNTRFSSDYSYNDIENNLGIKLYPERNKKSYMTNYTSIAYGQLKNGKITVFYNPIKPVFPYTYITTSDSSYDLFLELYKALPDLKVSALEYTIDLYCINQQHIADLFYLLRKNMYCSRGTSTATKGGRLDSTNLVRSTNAVYQVNLKSKSRYIKIYERGNDGIKQASLKKNKGLWKHKDCNRVRIEYTYKRPKLKRSSPDNMEDLLTNPNLRQILGDPDNKRLLREVSFKEFNHKDMPYPWAVYKSQDSRGHNDCFQEEFLQSKNHINNLSRYLKDYSIFDNLIKQIREAILEFENKWYLMILKHIIKLHVMACK
jgi:hypothetical protein